MFSSIKSRVITIYAIVLFLSIISSLFIGVIISKAYINNQVYGNMSVVYRVDTGEELDSIASNEYFNQERLMSKKGDPLQVKNDRILITSIIAVSLLLVGLFAILFNLGYDKFIKQAIITEQVSDFNQYKDLVTHQTEEITNTHRDVDKINSYISHELKNSLAILKTKQLNSEEFENYVDELNNQIDDIGALTANKLTNITDVDILIVLAALADNYQPAVEFDFADGEYNIAGNSTLLTRAFDNVINNAFKYGADKVCVDAYNFSGNVIVKISNNGKMISRAERDKIFDFKYRTPELKADGSGIGLALVRNIVELHNGGIYVESNQLETSFYFSFKIS